MQTIYKVFIVIFIVFGAVNLYALNYNESLMSDENSKHMISIIASLFGLLVTYILHNWSKLKVKQ